MLLNDEQSKSLVASLKGDSKTWFRLEDVARRVPEDNLSSVEETLNQSDFFVRSVNGPDSIPVYTSKEEFQEKAPFLQKLFGAFKNRID